MIKTFKGKLADQQILTIRLSTNNGLTGYKIKKFQVMTADTVGAIESASIIAVFANEPANASDSVNFDDPQLLAAIDYRQHSNEAYGIVANNIVFDDKIINQDIYITNRDNLTGANMNFYLELEQVKLDLNEATVATLKDMRGRE
tara:strand:+ start:135 stop:569 length:435 start_codon:yes stop_codon:yes gene_type:complete